MNIRNLLFSISVLCLSIALAAAQSTTTTPSSPDTHAQSAPGTQPPASPGPSSNSQSTTGQQSAAPSQGSSNANSGPSGQTSVEDELNLTQDQKQKIAEVVDDENKQISTVRNDTSMSMEQKQQKVMQIRQEGAPRIKAVLTPEQLQKLAVIQQRMREQQQGGAGASTPQSSPQGNAPQSTSPQSTSPQGSSPQR